VSKSASPKKRTGAQASELDIKLRGDNLSGMVAVAMEIAAEQVKLMRQLKATLLSGDDKRALQLARELCGIEDSSEG
jgi:hypothetical protein